MVGLEAMGIKNLWEPTIARRYEPDTRLHAIYLKQFTKFERLYKILTAEMNTPEEMVGGALTAS